MDLNWCLETCSFSLLFRRGLEIVRETPTANNNENPNYETPNNPEDAANAENNVYDQCVGHEDPEFAGYMNLVANLY